MTEETVQKDALPAGAKKRTLLWKLVTLALALVLVYLASPYVSFWSFTRAIKANDRAALESHVDFRSVRQSLKQELRARLPKANSARKEDALSGMVSRLGPGLIDQLVDAFVTPEGLAALLTDPAIARDLRARDPVAIAQVENRKRSLDWSRVRSAAFTGLRNFVVDIEGTQLHFRFSKMHWQLETIQLAPVI